MSHHLTRLLTPHISQHPWVTGQQSAEPLPPIVHERLKDFATMSRVRQVAMLVAEEQISKVGIGAFDPGVCSEDLGYLLDAYHGRGEIGLLWGRLLVILDAVRHMQLQALAGQARSGRQSMHLPTHPPTPPPTTHTGDAARAVRGVLSPSNKSRPRRRRRDLPGVEGPEPRGHPRGAGPPGP